jgi:hypothetical protein
MAGMVELGNFLLWSVEAQDAIGLEGQRRRLEGYAP